MVLVRRTEYERLAGGPKDSVCGPCLLLGPSVTWLMATSAGNSAPIPLRLLVELDLGILGKSVPVSELLMWSIGCASGSPQAQMSGILLC